MKKIKNNWLLFIGTLLIISAGITYAGFTIYHEAEDIIAERNAQILLMQVTSYNEYLSEPTPLNDPAEPASFFRQTLGNIVETVAPVNTTYASRVPDYDTAGIIHIPRINITLPVISTLTEALLERSVCLYSHSGRLEEAERLIISGHNYRSHFGKIPKLLVGDAVIFTDNNGVVHEYAVSNMFDMDMYDQLEILQGQWDLTLFTCDFKDRSRRIVVRCVRSK